MRGFFIAITAVMFMPHISQAHVSLHCPAGFLEVNSYGGSLTGGQGHSSTKVLGATHVFA